LIDAKALAGRDGWLPWLEREFEWTERTAQHFMSVGELAGKCDTVSDLNVDMRWLYVLARENTPADVIEGVAERSESGDRVSLDEVKQMIAEAQERVDGLPPLSAGVWPGC
jgi:hypothetical protein